MKERRPSVAALLPTIGGSTTLSIAIYSDSHVWLGLTALVSSTFISALWIVIPHEDAKQLRLWWLDRDQARHQAGPRWLPGRPALRCAPRRVPTRERRQEPPSDHPRLPH